MKRNDNVIQLLSDLVAIDSQSHKGNITIIDFLSKLLAGYSQTTQSWVREADGVKGKNLIVKIPGKSGEHSLIFVCHMDTVPTSNAWETDPFILEENGGNLHGLGACDTKGGVAALLEAVFTLTDMPAYDMYLVFDGDEEVMSTGASKYIKRFSLKNPHFIFLEPTDGELHIAQRALLKFDVTTYGVATHASLGTPEKNRKNNAINKMSEVLDLLIQDASEIAKEKHAYLASSTQNLGLLSGGTARNVFADTASITVDRRLLPERDPMREFHRVKKLLVAAIPDTTVEINNVEPGFSMPNDNAFVSQLIAIYQSVMPQARLGAFDAWSEAGLFADKGDVVIVGPGSIKQAHVANEYVSAQELFSFVHIFQKILQDIAF